MLSINDSRNQKIMTRWTYFIFLSLTVLLLSACAFARLGTSLSETFISETSPLVSPTPQDPMQTSWNDIGNPIEHSESEMEFSAISNKILGVAQQYNSVLPYSTELDYPRNKVIFYTTNPDVLRELLEKTELVRQAAENIEYIYQVSDDVSLELDEEGLMISPMVQFYADDMGIEYAEAKRRLSLQDEMSDLTGIIAENEPSYAGRQIQHEPDFGLIVSFRAANGNEIIQKYLADIEWAELVSVQQTEYSEDEFLAVSKQILNTIYSSTIDIPYETGKNFAQNKVNLYTSRPDELQLLIESIAELNEYVDHIEYIYKEQTSKATTQSTDNSASSDIPLIPEEGFVRWRLVEVVQDNQQVTFELVAPAYLIFAEQSIFNVVTFECGDSAYAVTADGPSTYSVASVFSSRGQCGADHEVEKREQGHRLERIVAQTNQFQIEGNQLTLSGESITAVLELEESE